MQHKSVVALHNTLHRPKPDDARLTHSQKSKKSKKSNADDRRELVDPAKSLQHGLDLTATVLFFQIKSFFFLERHAEPSRETKD